MSTFLWDARSLKKDVFIQAPKKPKKNKEDAHTYASFGHNGTTATVNQYGHIMQISRYLGVGLSGFLCADAQYCNPYYVQDRVDELVGSFGDLEMGLRLDLVHWEDFESRPSLGFMYDRWPRYVFNKKKDKRAVPDKTPHTTKTGTRPTESQAIRASGTAASKAASTATHGTSGSPPKPPPFPLSIQCYCSGGSVIQKYLIHIGDDGVPHDRIKWGNLPLAQDVWIRSLDFTKRFDYNSTDFSSELGTFIVSDNNLVVVHSFCQKDRKELNIDCPDDKGRAPIAAALIISPFKDNAPVKIVNGNCIELQDTEGQTPLEITVAYTLRLLYPDRAEVGSSATPTNSKTDHAQDEYVPATNEPVSKCETTGSTQGDTISTVLSDISERRPCVEDLLLAINEIELGQESDSRANTAIKDMESTFTEIFTFRKIYFSPDPGLDFVFRRNLEHILSVCCIPIFQGSPRQISVAITCGDIAGHRVGPRASLSTVQFLCSALAYLKPNDATSQKLRDRSRRAYIESEPVGEHTFENDSTLQPGEENVSTGGGTNFEHPYLLELYKRVREALRGHNLWVATVSEVGETGTYAPHYWPTGRKIDDLTWLSPLSLIDTPLQLLKIMHTIDRGVKVEVWSSNEISAKIRFWLAELHASNARGAYAFPREPVDPKKLYYGGEQQCNEPRFNLSDHVMIALALKCVEQLRYYRPNGRFDLPAHGETLVKSITSSKHEQPDGKVQLESIEPQENQCYYGYEEVRGKVLKRFSTIHPTSKQRMLATSRRSNKTRFLLHSKDTFLFLAANTGFFKAIKEANEDSSEKEETKVSKLSKSERAWRHSEDRWVKLLEVQASHDEFQHMDWSSPLWYALVFVLSCKGKRVNNQSPEDSLKDVQDVLLGLSWNNGLFPGLLGSDRQPLFHEDEMERDNYWFTTFEIPNILLSYSVDSIYSSRKPQSGNTTSNRDLVGRTGQQAGKYVPFLNLSPPKDLVGRDILSDDWLQGSSAILNFDADVPLASTSATTEDQCDQKAAEARLKAVLEKIPVRSSPKQVGFLIDVPRYSMGYEMSDTRQNLSDIKKQRTVWQSKKRIVWLPCLDKDVAEDLHKVSSRVEKMNVLSFLGRHVNFETLFLDNATAALNEWETELHLSFYRISHAEKESVHLLDKSTFLARTTMSFRFAGDFSDRYWTCYFMERGTDFKSTEKLGSRLIPHEDCRIRGDLDLQKPYKDFSVAQRMKERKELGEKTGGIVSLGAWQQRRVLELLIYSKVLEQLNSSTEEILANIKRLALQSEKHHSSISGENPFTTAIKEAERLQELGDEANYAFIADGWRKYIQILDVIEENLTDNIEKIKQWERREEDRKNGQPRWTDRDKQKHSASILQLTILCQRQANDIERLRNKVQTFRESLPSRLETIRNDIQFRDSQNINLFTYVTVVFLPLGFATGLLSMSEAPHQALLMNLIALSLAALSITLFALLNAPVIKFMVSPFTRRYHDLSWILWQLMKYSGYIVTVRIMTYHANIELSKMGASTSVQLPADQDLENQTAAPGEPVRTTWDHWRERWQEGYRRLMQFSYKDAVRQAREELLSKKKKATAKAEAPTPSEPEGCVTQPASATISGNFA